MTINEPASELSTLLASAQQALTANDCEAANKNMDAAAALCAELQQRGVMLSPAELSSLRELAQRCGTALFRARDALNAESQRDDNHRRALLTYGQSR
jgi:hypothetical protein